MRRKWSFAHRRCANKIAHKAFHRRQYHHDQHIKLNSVIDISALHGKVQHKVKSESPQCWQNRLISSFTVYMYIITITYGCIRMFVHCFFHYTHTPYSSRSTRNRNCGKINKILTLLALNLQYWYNPLPSVCIKNVFMYIVHTYICTYNVQIWYTYIY